MNKILKLSVLILVILGIISYYSAFQDIINRNRQLSSNQIELSTQAIQNTSNKAPINFYIDSLNLKLPIIETQLNEGTWEYTNEGIMYLKESGEPGESGNVIFYGHNFKNLLKDLNKIEIGEEVKIEFNNLEYKTFVVTSKYTVSPDQTHILNQTNDIRITIMTCTGFLDSKRLIVTAIEK